MPTHIDELISAHWVLPIAPEHTVLLDHSIAIDQGCIQEVLPTDQALQRYQAKTHSQFPNHVVLPGFMNGHAHSAMALFRGLADDIPLQQWLHEHMWPAERHALSGAAVRCGTELAMAEMIRGGTTFFSDHFFSPLTIADAVVESGMRACVGLIIMNAPNYWAESEEDYLAKAKQALLERPHNERLLWSIAPHAPYTVSNAGFHQAKQLADQYGLPIHMHLHETRYEIEQSLQTHGCRPLQRLMQLNFLSKAVVGVHMVHLTDEDFDLILKTGMSIIHCPESNLKLGSGIAPIQKALDLGITVGLGTDGAASNNDLDMLGELRSAAMLAKGFAMNPKHLSAYDVLKMATLDTARAYGFERQLGSLESGKWADLIAIDLNDCNTQPTYDPVSQIVYAVNSRQVSDVWVAGKRLLQNGIHQTLDIQRILAEARSWRERLQPFAYSQTKKNLNRQGEQK